MEQHVLGDKSSKINSFNGRNIYMWMEDWLISPYYDKLSINISNI